MNIKFKGIAFEIEYFCKNVNILSLLNDVMHLCSIKGLISFFFYSLTQLLITESQSNICHRTYRTNICHGKYCIYKRQSYRYFNKSKVICTLCEQELHEIRV